MKSRHSSVESENSIGSRAYLEFTVHLLDMGCFNPIVFSHDNYWFDRKRYARVIAGFLKLLSFLDSCGIWIETEVHTAGNIEDIIYKHTMTEANHIRVVSYELQEIDFSCFSLEKAQIPSGCAEDDFSLVRLYLALRTGAALNKTAIERMLKRELTDAEMLTLRRQLTTITDRRIVKRKDNSYEMR